MLRTPLEQFLVAGRQRTHLWFEVLHGEDSGIRVSIPRYHEEYSSALGNRIRDLEAGDCVRAELVSPTETPPQWRVKRLQK